ncbi:MAG: VOC family protein [Anaerolineae bacterium]|nr:MAG: VOC family protein [Anaerolineae bacterium]
MLDRDIRHKLPFLRNGIAQIAIIVEDLEAAVENYWRMFGIGDWHFYTYGRPLLTEMTYGGQPGEYKMRVALSYLGPMRIELIEMVEGDTVYADFVEEHGYGVHHFGVLVEDMEEAIAQAKAAGLKVTMEGAGFGRDGDGHYAYLDTEDKIGVTIELIERPRGRVPPEKIYPHKKMLATFGGKT